MRNIIANYNSKGQRHGYNERYSYISKLCFKCFYYNGIEIDYEEFYDYYGKLEKRFYV